jgi:alpha-L-fucosidase
MDELVEKARAKQPGLIVVDRAVPGINQNYLTPENRVPEKALPYPWESCIIAGGGWSWAFNPTYMTDRQGIHLLVDIVAKGGNLLLNIAPGPEGQWHPEAYRLLEGYADWMKVNNEAIYGTRAIEPFKEGKVCLTQKKDGTTYAIYLAGENENALPEKIWMSSVCPDEGSDIHLLGSKEKLNWHKVGEGFYVEIPESIRKNPPCNHAWTLQLGQIK